MKIQFRVEGTPITQGSKNCYCRGNRAIVTESQGQKLKKWRKLVADKATEEMKALGLDLINDAVSVKFIFYLEKPKSKPRTKTLADTGFDADKLVRAVNDSLTKTVFTNDARVVDIVASKRYAIGRPPGVDIVVETVIDPGPQNQEKLL